MDIINSNSIISALKLKKKIGLNMGEHLVLEKQIITSEITFLFSFF